MNYLALLAKLGRTPQEMGASVQQKIKQYEKLVNGIEKAKANLAIAKTDSRKQKLAEEIEEAEIALKDHNEVVCEAITRYNKNFEKNKQKGERLNAARLGKSGSAADPAPQDPPADPPVNDDPPADPPVNDDPPADPPVNDDPAADPGDPEPKKKKNSFALFGGILLAAVALIAGVGYIESRKS